MKRLRSDGPSRGNSSRRENEATPAETRSEEVASLSAR